MLLGALCGYIWLADVFTRIHFVTMLSHS